jgi:uncharacterized membrane protein YfcA
MRIGDVVLLLGAGFVAGAVNAVAGGGSLITFPALLATGLAPVPANVTNSLSVCPGYLSSVLGSRPDLAGQGPRAARLLPAAVVGALIGAALLLATPPRAFALIVPFLVLSATAVLAAQPRLQAVIGHPRQLSPRRRTVALQTLTGLGAVYGGYFGGALGVVLLAVLALVLDERLQRVAALKNVLSATVGVATVLAFAVFGPVSWPSVAVLAPATVTGGYLGARLVRRMPAGVLRWTVVAFGTVVGVALLVRAVIR